MSLYTLEKARHAQAELNLAEKNQELLGKLEETRKQGEIDRAEKLADAALPGRMVLYWAIAIAIVGLFIFLSYVLIMKIAEGELTWLPDAYEKASVVIDVIAEVIVGIIGFLVFNKGLCGLDKNAIRERLIERYSK